MIFDHVTCFKCVRPNMIERWVSRHRRKGWPDMVRKISQLDGHVVPVGLKGSPTMNTEWKICYTLAELHLIRYLNEAQLKVYVLLKMLSKYVLRKVCTEITSNVMENIAFWMCETTWDVSFSR